MFAFERSRRYYTQNKDSNCFRKKQKNFGKFSSPEMVTLFTHKPAHIYKCYIVYLLLSRIPEMYNVK